MIEEYTFETEYEVGDAIVFRKCDELQVGIIEGGYVDRGADDTWWFNVRVSQSVVYSYSNKGDIGESDIITVLRGREAELAKAAILAIE